MFRFTIRKDMVPRARVVVYHILPDGEVVADALDFDVMGTFQNTVSGAVGSKTTSALIKLYICDLFFNHLRDGY